MALDYIDVLSTMNERADKLESDLNEAMRENSKLKVELMEARRALAAERERSSRLERLVPALTAADAIHKAAIRDLQFVRGVQSTEPGEEATTNDQAVEGLKNDLLKRDRELTNAHRALFDLQARFQKLRQAGTNTNSDHTSTRKKGPLRPTEQTLQKRKRHDSQARSESIHLDPQSEPGPSALARYIQAFPKRLYSNLIPEALMRFLTVPSPGVQLPTEAYNRVFTRDAIKKVCSVSSVKSLNFSAQLQAYIYVLKRHLGPWLPERPLSHGIIWALYPGSSNLEKNAAASSSGIHLFVENTVPGPASRSAVRYLYCGRYDLDKMPRSREELGPLEGTEDRTDISRLLPIEWKNLTEQFRATYADEIKMLFHISSQNEMAQEFDAGNRHIPIRMARCIGYDIGMLNKLLEAEGLAPRPVQTTRQPTVIDISDD
ncbi:hypothetical protein FRB95_002431 [Tulasnella sp. JGI-2019a]|nr:hypothetical protein FRB95_002431 [Tulasnella sp. JGI-2019a]